ncbi:MAG: FAD-dependent oxidoreductase [Candidatus Kerfeldbacteria bacterium]|nr:FAD-dependent oxidoreductase [Candidatus Kerfeldbacteria bacterium]
MSDAQYDVIIVGGAAAGLTAALYASRRALKTLVITKSIGGQAALTPSIENYPGTQKISGIDLMMQFQAHAASYGAEFAYETVTSLKKENNVFTVATHNATRTARAVILAFGLTPRNLDVPGEIEFQGKGVTYCATCDAPLYKNKTTVVVGSTYEALDAALLLAKLNSKVTLVHEKKDYPAYTNLFEQVKASPLVTLALESRVTAVMGDTVVRKVEVEDVNTHEKREVECAGVFVEKGHKIDSSWVGDLVELDKKRSIIVDPENRTKTEGLFAAGDVTPLRDKQVVVSAGDGAKAALSAYAYIQKQIGKPAVAVDWKHG